MPAFYTKTQIDAIATIIGQRIKSMAGGGSGDGAAVALSGATPTLDLSAGAAFTHTATENAVFSVTNVPAGAWTRTLIVNADAGHALTFPANWDWGEAGLPDVFSSGGGTMEIALRAEGSGDVRARLEWSKTAAPAVGAGTRFWRVVFQQTQGSPQFIITTTELRGAVGGPTLCVDAEAGTRASTNSGSQTDAAKGFTANSDYWQVGRSTSNPPWLAWEFANPVTINEVRVLGLGPTFTPSHVSVESSSDGVSWTQEWVEQNLNGDDITSARP